MLSLSFERILCSLRRAQVDDEDAWVLATVEERFGGSVHLKRLHAPAGVDLKLVIADEEFVGWTPATGDLDSPVDDLVQLNDVNQGALLHTLRQRYARDDVYTSIGSILIAINPFKRLAACSPETIAKMTAEVVEARGLEEKIKPHIFKTVLAAYTGMCQSGRPQSVLISGESGAGKTETAKLCMTCLVEMSESSGASIQVCTSSNIACRGAPLCRRSLGELTPPAGTVHLPRNSGGPKVGGTARGVWECQDCAQQQLVSIRPLVLRAL